MKHAKIAISVFTVVVLAAIGVVFLFGGDDEPDKASASASTRRTTTTTEPEPEPGTEACDGIEYLGVEPDIEGVEFGDDAVEAIENFENLTPGERALEVEKLQRQDWCEYSLFAMTAAIHRGIVEWPANDGEWVASISELHDDRAKHAALVQKILDWEQENVDRLEVVHVEGEYFSDYVARQNEGPALLRHGTGSSSGPGYVVRRHLKDGTILTERLGCRWQIVSEVPPPVPPIKPPPVAPPLENPPPEEPPPPPPEVEPKDPDKSTNNNEEIPRQVRKTQPSPDNQEQVDEGPVAPVDSPTGCVGSCHEDPTFKDPPPTTTTTRPPSTSTTTVPSCGQDGQPSCFNTGVNPPPTTQPPAPPPQEEPNTGTVVSP